MDTKKQRQLLFLLVLWLLLGCREAATPAPRRTLPAALPTVASTPAPAAAETPAGEDTAFLPWTANGAATEPSGGPVTPVPSATAVAPSPTASPSARPSATPDYPVYNGSPLSPENAGIQIHLHREDLGVIIDHLRRLHVGWVKVQLEWKIFEPAPGRYDEERFHEVDQLVARASENGIRVLLSVAKAPEWTRVTTELDGPPQDPAHYRAFMRYLAGRYRGQVAAYELWNEANLQREWNGAPLDPASLVNLIRAGAAGVREADPAATIVSGAPAVTGINDGTTALEDRGYLQGMLATGLGEVVDAVGVHPYGWANPPDASAADATQVAPTHNNHPSFFFADTLRDYRRLLTAAGYPDLPLWVTEFGWASSEGMDAPPPAGAEFMAYVDEREQATYTLRAYELAAQWSGVGPLFLWNLNFAPTFGAAFSESFYSVLRPDGSPRPVYRALQNAFERRGS